MVPSNTQDSLSCLDFDSLLSGLEKKLLISLKGTELLAMKLQVDRLQNRVAELESKKPSLEPLPSAPLQGSEGTRIPNVRMSTASPEAMETKMAQLTETIANQQKQLERNEREKREKNVIIIGLRENEANVRNIVHQFLENKMDIPSFLCFPLQTFGKSETRFFAPKADSSCF